MTRVVVAGAGVAGLSTCRALRTEGYDGEIVLLDAETHVPYDRPPLSKKYLTTDMSPREITLPDAGSLEEIGVDHRRGTPALGLDDGTVHTAAGAVTFDKLVIATGSRARRLPAQEGLAGVHCLRTVEDADRLRAELVAGRRLVVIGAGFIGLEVASAARMRGVEVTVVERAATPLAHALSVDVAAWLVAEHESQGVRFRLGVQLSRFVVSGPRVAGVELSDGEVLPADLVVVGIGGIPNVEWLDGTGLASSGGVLCDQYLRAGPSIYAVGDVAGWVHPVFGAMRAEHWSTAGDHARVAAANIAAEVRGEQPTRQAAEIPYFWTDQYSSKIQLAGWTRDADEIEVISGAPKWEVLFRRGGRIVAALGVNRAAFVARHRRSMGADEYVVTST